MNLTEARQKLMELQSVQSAYRHAMGAISFDGNTTAPSGTAANRAHTLSILSGINYKNSTSEETKTLLDFLYDHNDELSEKEQRMVYLLRENQVKTAKIPMEFFIEHRRLMIQSADVWHKAKAADDFASFEPLLEKVFEDAKKLAGYCNPEMDPFDYWLNESEEGMDSKKCDEFFAEVKATVVPLIKAIGEKPQVDDSIINGHFPEYKQRELSYYLMDLMGQERDHVGLATTEHPFTTSLGSQYDVRLTTHYYDHSYSPAMYSVIHEGGHGLYFRYPAEEYAYTALDGGASMGLHESQSRFYENYIGRSRGFIDTVFPKIAEIFPEACKGKTPEDLYKAVNKVSPGLIRIEADEVTYTLHIVIRYEIERMLLAGELKIHDVPDVWNKLYKEYLGVDVTSYNKGCIQDSHWGSGLIGYFPTYSLGTAYGAQFLAKMKETVDFDKCVADGNLAPINEWNRENIWRHGRLYTPAELLSRVFEGPFSPKYYTEYLVNKYTEVYGLDK